MKQVLFLLVLSLFLQARCNKEMVQDPDSYEGNTAALFNNTQETIHIGDSLKIEITLPDTISAVNYLNQMRSEKLTVLKEAYNFFSLFQLDTVSKIGYYLSQTKPEHYLYDHFNFSMTNVVTRPYDSKNYFKDTPPYRIAFTLVPKKKGIYWMELLPVSFSVNQSFKGRLKTSLAGDNHWYLVYNNILPSQDYMKLPQLNKLAQYYAFRVN